MCGRVAEERQSDRWQSAWVGGGGEEQGERGWGLNLVIAGEKLEGGWVWSELRASVGEAACRESCSDPIDAQSALGGSPGAVATGAHCLPLESEQKLSTWSELLNTCTGLPQRQSWVLLFQKRDGSHRRVQATEGTEQSTLWGRGSVRCAQALPVWAKADAPSSHWMLVAHSLFWWHLTLLLEFCHV